MATDREGREIIKSQKDFFERCVDKDNNIKANNVRLQFELDLASRNSNKDKNIDLGRVNFINSVFEYSVDFDESRFSGEASFDRATFSGEASFFEATFSGKASFLMATFSEEADFVGATFSGVAGFFGATFSAEADFRRTIFSGVADFNNAEFSKVNFKRAFFKEKANFIETYFTLNALYWGTKFKKEVYFDGAIFENNSQLRGAFIEHGDRETFRIIKHEFLKQNNRIEALEYHKREMKAYWRDLWNTEEIKWYQKPGEKSIIGLNRISTNYGTAWMQGVAFTLVTAFIFYGAFLFLSNCPGWSFEAYFRFLNPTHSYKFLRDFIPYDSAYIIDMVGRVLIGYGYYQTIQAFRKYKRI
ncbi:MAG: pentapeptide repeat-containing protein [Bacteroidales bacterium]|nr:pentapeptide repeat-containing protein [Bacteroidales bacterium]